MVRSETKILRNLGLCISRNHLNYFIKDKVFVTIQPIHILPHTALLPYSNDHIVLYAHILSATIPCSGAKSKHSEQ